MTDRARLREASEHLSGERICSQCGEEIVHLSPCGPTHTTLLVESTTLGSRALALLADAPDANLLERFARYMNDGEKGTIDRGEWMMLRDWQRLVAAFLKDEDEA